MESHASLESNNDASATVTDTGVSVSYDGTTKAEGGVSVGDENASASVGVSAKTGTEAGFSAGLDGNNVVAEAHYSDATVVEATVAGSVNYEGVGADVSGTAYAKSGTEADCHVAAGESGIDVGANASMGSSIGVDGEGTVNLREASATAGAGVSVGEHVEAGGGGQATFNDGKATVGVNGELAALVGLEVDVSVTVDTNQITDDVNTVVEVAPDAALAAEAEAETSSEPASDERGVVSETGSISTLETLALM